MKIDVINGLLGSGKTTFLLNLLEQKDEHEKVAILVNEFGEIGIDGDILGGHGADVVELPNGCICCTLTSDLRTQIRVIAETFQPDRLIIEPTGVATIKNLLNILRSLSLEKYIDDIRVTVVIDASTFGDFLAQNRGFLETQVKMAERVIINKCDKASHDEIKNIKVFIKNVNNSGEVLMTAFGRVLNKDAAIEEPPPAQDSGGLSAEGHDCESQQGHEHEHGYEEHQHGYEEHQHGHEHVHEVPLKKYEQFSNAYSGTFDRNRLMSLFADLMNGCFGPVDRAKGIFFLSDNRWVRIDLASREIRATTVDREFKSSKIVVVGTELLKEKIMGEFRKCLIKTG